MTVPARATGCLPRADGMTLLFFFFFGGACGTWNFPDYSGDPSHPDYNAGSLTRCALGELPVFS